MPNYPTNQQNNQDGKYSTAKDVAFLFVALCAAIIAFFNLPGMLVIALYDQNIRRLDINQCWTFSFCVTGGLIIIFRILSGNLKSAFKTHLFLSFLVFAYLAVSYFGLEQQYPRQYLKLFVPQDMLQKSGPQLDAPPQ
jgi:hypothetical protein